MASQLSLFASCVVLAFAQLHSAVALTCYETDSNGDIVERSNDEWIFCAMTPTHMSDGKLVEGRAFGLHAEADITDSYHHLFAHSDEVYQVLSVCVYEKYSFDAISPKFKNTMPAEYMFRCVCNYDLCNQETTFSAYLASFKKEQK
ncbi:hypothetical protein AAVH_16489 [Aphelenchoides avenae]|nr:hypothetical protein AAVH_16489 [Aphelenchus avenae]